MYFFQALASFSARREKEMLTLSIIISHRILLIILSTMFKFKKKYVKLDHMEVKLDRILRKLFPEEEKLKRPHGIPAFPLRTEKEWNTLEDILTDDNAFTYVVNILAVCSIFNCPKLHIFPFASYYVFWHN